MAENREPQRCIARLGAYGQGLGAKIEDRGYNIGLRAKYLYGDPSIAIWPENRERVDRQYALSTRSYIWRLYMTADYRNDER
jgi:hypothetical protein